MDLRLQKKPDKVFLPCPASGYLKESALRHSCFFYGKRSYFRVAYITALMVCMRFSASSKTLD